MVVSRRLVLSGLCAMGLGACVGGAAAQGRASHPWIAVPNEGFAAWLGGMKGRAAAHGISASSQGTLMQAGYLPAIIEKSQYQTEFKRTIEDYLAIATAPERVAAGRAEFVRRAALLGQIEAAYGVAPQIVTAIWGLESRYGARMGDAPLISGLATLSYAGRRASFFEAQLMAALKILDRGDVTAARMTGSWAGAMGHTQFIPTTFLAHAVDFTGDGRCDIWGDDPADALASAAAYLRDAGWQKGALWGLEVTVPVEARDQGAKRSVAGWQALGARAASGGAVPDFGAAKLHLTGGVGTPSFLLFRNFNVLLRYNNAFNYGLGVGVLSERIAGGGALRGQFPPDAAGMTLAERQQMQRKLAALGYDVGSPDGVIGDKTRAAIADFERANGMPVTGEPSAALLSRL
jgi:membrane-bound lytic murein transglycosylase B